MNVYDFDDTIYNGDTNKDLIKYSLKKYPKRIGSTVYRHSIGRHNRHSDGQFYCYRMDGCHGRRYHGYERTHHCYPFSGWNVGIDSPQRWYRLSHTRPDHAYQRQTWCQVHHRPFGHTGRYVYSQQHDCPRNRRSYGKRNSQ